jgi:hypothetical protein
MSAALEDALRQFQRGLAQDNAEDIYPAWRALYHLGTGVGDALEKMLLDADWTSVEQPKAVQFFAGYLGLLHDIDERRSRKVMEDILHRGCDPVFRSVLTSIRSFTKSDYEILDLAGIPIWIEKKIRDHAIIAPLLKTWLNNVPPADLRGIDRITVVRRRSTMDYGGLYMPRAATLVLVWDNNAGGVSPLARLFQLLLEFTLYHEIGHHYHDHSFGQDQGQEREADRYATETLKAAHPKTMRPTIFLCKRIRRLSTRSNPDRALS